jgi:hypothetical protein
MRWATAHITHQRIIWRPLTHRRVCTQSSVLYSVLLSKWWLRRAQDDTDGVTGCVDHNKLTPDSQSRSSTSSGFCWRRRCALARRVPTAVSFHRSSLFVCASATAFLFLVLFTHACTHCGQFPSSSSSVPFSSPFLPCPLHSCLCTAPSFHRPSLLLSSSVLLLPSSFLVLFAHVAVSFHRFSSVLLLLPSLFYSLIRLLQEASEGTC